MTSAESNATSETSTLHRCIHCGTEWAPRRNEKQAPEFCCSGCEAAYHLIESAGLEDFYRYRSMESTWEASPVSATESAREMDSPEFLAKHAKALQGGSGYRILLDVAGVHCRACVWLIEQLPRMVPGVIEARLNLQRRQLDLTWDLSIVKLSSVADQLRALGYEVDVANSTKSASETAEQRRWLMDIAIAAALGGNLMLIAVALYAGWFSGMDPQIEQFFRWTSALLGMAVIVFPARLFFVRAAAGIRSGSPNMDVPIALGLTLGTAAGLINTVRGSGEIYFDSLAMLVFLLLLGRWIQFRQHRSASDKIQALYHLAPKRARVIDKQGEQVWRTIDTLEVGEVILVKADESIPADGMIESGESAIDPSLMTGEFMPENVAPGDTVFGGVQNLLAPLRIRVTAVGDASKLGQLMQLVEDASLSKTPMVQLADRLSRWFVVAILGLTISTAVAWWWAGAPGFIGYAIAVAIVACPCALGLATPLGVAVAIGRAARQRILIKGGEILERLTRPGIVWLDKTGTLTEGRLRVASFVGDHTTSQAVLCLERQSSHPVAIALTEYLNSIRNGTEMDDEQGENIERSSLGGIGGTLEGASWAVGTRRYVEFCGANITKRFQRWEKWVLKSGASPVYVSKNQVVVAGFAVSDELRYEAPCVVEGLRSSGWRIGILSGDHPEVVQRIARQLHLPKNLCRGGLSPEDKQEIVRASRSDYQTVVMVGDGLNDSAALAAGDVGVSMNASPESSLESADVHLGKPGLEPLAMLFTGSRRAMRSIRWALAASLAYNLGAVSCAMAGWINPLSAALLMPLSSLTVLAIALTGPAFRDEKRPLATLESAEDVEAIRSQEIETNSASRPPVSHQRPYAGSLG